MLPIDRLVAALFLLTGTVDNGAETPRYQLEVGQRITYVGKVESRYKADRYTVHSDDAIEWSLWVVRKNADGSWRIVVQSRKTTTRLGEGGARRASPAETAMGYLDIHPDGRIIPNRSIGYHFDPLGLFPPMPPDAAAAEKGWDEHRERDLAVRRFKPSRAGGDVWTFEEQYESPINRVSESVTVVKYVFGKGILQHAETSTRRTYFAKGTTTETLALKAVETAGRMEQLAAESDELFKAYAAYWDLEDRAAIENTRHARAETVLLKARQRITLPLLRDQIDSLLARHHLRDTAFQQPGVFAQSLGKPGPEWEATDLDGKSHAAEDYRGNVVILDFWNRGCGWCIRAMPQLKAIEDEFRGQPVQILGMNLDENESDARFVVEQMGIRYPTVRALGLAEKYHVGGIPHLVILDREGKVVDIHIGYAPMLKERVSNSIKQILNRAR